MLVSVPSTSRITLPTALAALVEAGMMSWAAPQPTPQLPRGAMHSFLGDGDGVDCGHESFHNAKIVMDDLGQGSQAVGGALLIILRELSYFSFKKSFMSYFTPITNMGAPAEGAEMMTRLAPLFK